MAKLGDRGALRPLSHSVGSGDSISSTPTPRCPATPAAWGIPGLSPLSLTLVPELPTRAHHMSLLHLAPACTPSPGIYFPSTIKGSGPSGPGSQAQNPSTLN